MERLPRAAQKGCGGPYSAELATLEGTAAAVAAAIVAPEPWQRLLVLLSSRLWKDGTPKPLANLKPEQRRDDVQNAVGP